MKNKIASSWQSAVGRIKLSVVAKRVVALCCMIMAFASSAFAQADTTMMQAQQKVDMADTMRSNGKIYVVVAVLVIILLGLFIYLIRLDRKIGKLEKE